jgi:hypothetical protein
MTLDTPLAEVAAHLPRQAAITLVEKHPLVQKTTLEMVRSALVFWETNGVDLDPIQFDAVVTILVVQVSGLEEALLDSTIKLESLTMSLKEGRPRE